MYQVLATTYHANCDINCAQKVYITAAMQNFKALKTSWQALLPDLRDLAQQHTLYFGEIKDPRLSGPENFDEGSQRCTAITAVLAAR